MNQLITKIKEYLFLVLLPTAVLVILSISSLKDIEQGYARFKFGRDITLYLRKSTDQLTYLGSAYTSTSDKKFLNQFNIHLKEREKYFNEEIFISKMLTQEELIEFRKALDISSDLAKEIEKPAFENMDNKAFFSDKYLDYKRRIIESNQNFRTLINDSSEKIIKDETKLLNIYLYSLCLIIILLVYLIKTQNQPIKKKTIKKKKK
tara:strand:- start:661 stop:1278 length:618 start_codon:yes stop_codon:yes gene_type:complete